MYGAGSQPGAAIQSGLDPVRKPVSAEAMLRSRTSVLEIPGQPYATVTPPLNVLLVEDNPGDAHLVREAMADTHALKIVFEHVDRMELAVERLQKGGIDMVLLDLGLPDRQGLAVVAEVRAVAPHVPILVLTELEDEDLALAALQAGAQDYLVKRHLDHTILERALSYARERNRVAQSLMRKSLELASANQKLQALNQQKDEFISRVSHELRTPLAAIHQFTTLLNDGVAGETSQRQHEFLTIVQRNVGEINTMVEELLEATRAEAGKLSIQPRRTPIGEVLRETLETARALASSKCVALPTDLPADLPPVYADPQRVRQVLINLIDNGIRYTTKNGSVTVSARVTGPKQRFLCVSVQDTGEGMRPEVSEHVFERLYQDERSAGNRHGLGLGLYICKQLVAHQGGRIWVESQPGHGSRFSFTLPLFSLPELLAPLLVQKKRQVHAATALRIEMVRTGRVRAERAYRKALGAWRHRLGGNLPAATLLVPELGALGSAEPIHLVMAVDSSQARSLAVAIRDQLAQSFTGLEPRLFLASLHLPVDHEESAGSTLHQISERLEKLIEEDTTSALWKEV